ncbi:Sedlin [Dissoconium aciculare CBS 342.82]|uniref:Sedlin n=1 Tax=Dissoconium aciculare CBS 342.82 TaxID=1314786 RepID=A0A6J3M9V0_9PEZI|nr:Sedlin [Dissoconium aciculare CBS 342.82]KAF1824399.1 Sedlin [Dissoconium aciculare CBS 342.82]
MDLRSPSIAAIGIIGRNNNPLHIALFPCIVTAAEQPSNPAPQERDELEYSMMLNSCLDIFEARMPVKTAGHDFGLLQALDERLAMYGWLLNTGIKLVIVVDMEGRPAEAGRLTSALGLRNSDLTPAFQALQTAYINLLRNPFYVPDEHDPRLSSKSRGASLRIESPKFTSEVERIGNAWYPGIASI